MLATSYRSFGGAATANALLDVGRFRDYGPNGLQVEGRDEVRHLVSGVTASRALIEAALAGADAILFVAAHVAQTFGLAHRFSDIDNPA